LHPGVAGGAWDRGLAAQVGRDEWAHDVPAELLFEIQHVVPDAERPRDATRVREIVQRAAAAGPPRLAGVIPELHREADHLVSLVAQKEPGDRGIDAPGHGD